MLKIPEGVGKSSVRLVKAGETLRALRTLLEGDEEEQRETFEFLRQALDQDRPLDCKLFPSE